jgi:hypothetical protein
VGKYSFMFKPSSRTNFLVVNERNSVVYSNNQQLEALGPYFVITQDLLDEDGIGFIV